MRTTFLYLNAQKAGVSKKPFNDIAIFIHTRHTWIFMNQAITKAHNATNIIIKFCKRMTLHEAMQAMRKKRQPKDEKKQCKKNPNVENDYNLYGT